MGTLLDKQTVNSIDESVVYFVHETIKHHKVAVFSKTFCPYCRKAKQILSSYPIKEDCLEIIELEKRPDMSQIQSYLKELTGASTVRILIDSLNLISLINVFYFSIFLCKGTKNFH